MHRLTYHLNLPAFVVALAVLLAACGGEDATNNQARPEQATPAEDASAQAGADAGFNDADVTFLQGMIPHHEQATEMAQLVAERSDRQELIELADVIIAAQSTEIDQMMQLLSEAGAEPMSEGDMSGMDGMDGMSGMMDDSEMTQLRDLEGEAFEQAFLDMMTRHHMGAIEMAQQELDEGENPQVIDLANQVIEAQQAEIEQMAAWQQEWFS
ncbi:MAG TPA: DUF305 domain-containing protein [Dermatophilaceae bacterium]|nr:DUF305 domain-containing protein [Dermatophilaceae bacterium]